MKKIFLCLTALFLIVGNLMGCAETRADDGRPDVVCTTFPQYDWARRIAGETDNLHITLLVSGGRDMHSYNPSASDIAAITDSDLLIYGGGISETWVKEIAKNRRSGRTINLMEVLGSGVKTEELPMGAQADDDGDGGEADEHVWLSLKNASLFCRRIAEEFCRLDEANADIYRKNCEVYCAQLDALDRDFAAFAAGSAMKTLVFADRYPFRYLLDDYGLSCCAAFPGCSAESEASFETVIFLAGKVDELEVPGVIVIDGSDGRIADAVLKGTQSKTGKIFRLDSMQSVTDIENESYLDSMRQNLEIIREALQ